MLWPERDGRHVGLRRRGARAGIVAGARPGGPSSSTSTSPARRTGFDLPLELHGTPFQLAAWQALAEIPYGETRSYAEQAARIGRPAAVRAVGAANGRNPVSIVLPCHRVSAATAPCAGSAAGSTSKAWLLALEAGVRLQSDDSGSRLSARATRGSAATLASARSR